MVPIGAFVALCASTLLNKRRRDGWAFFMTSLTIILLSASVFAGMFPRVLISSLGSIYDLTIYNAASGDYALKLMTYFSIAILPFVLEVKYGVSMCLDNLLSQIKIWSTNEKKRGLPYPGSRVLYVVLTIISMLEAFSIIAQTVF